MTIKKRLLISNILMIVVPVIAASAAGICCIALLWVMLQSGGGLPLEDSGDFFWASRAVVKLVSRSLEEGKPLDTLGETLQANGLRGTVCSGGAAVYTWGKNSRTMPACSGPRRAWVERGPWCPPGSTVSALCTGKSMASTIRFSSMELEARSYPPG